MLRMFGCAHTVRTPADHLHTICPAPQLLGGLVERYKHGSYGTNMPGRAQLCQRVDRGYRLTETLLGLGLQEGDDGEDAPVVSAATGRRSFWKMLVTCVSTPRSLSERDQAGLARRGQVPRLLRPRRWRARRIRAGLARVARVRRIGERPEVPPLREAAC
jgi:hypothetical protein